MGRAWGEDGPVRGAVFLERSEGGELEMTVKEKEGGWEWEGEGGGRKRYQESALAVYVIHREK